MECIASQDRINKEQIPGGATKNDSALKALERMAPGGGKDGDDCYVETSIDLADVNGEVIAENIRQALYRETYESWSQVTLWGKLIGEWVPSFFLGLVPRVEDAIVIPFTPGLREEFKSIKTSEYNFTSIEATMPRVPRAVGIFHTVQQLTGLNAAFDSTKSSPGLAGYFEPDGAEDGLVILKDAPGWLTDDVLVWLKSKNTTGSGKQDGEVIGTAMHPGEGPDEAGIPADDTRESMGSILNNFAQQWYIVEMLKGRQGEISGKLRWDIAPYSTIKLEALGERFTPGDQLASPMWGTVMRVSTQINSEQSRGATAFSIAHIRNEAENGDDKTSIDSPPLYTNKFTGCSLADGF
jgi:hypothetical protein